MLRLHPNILESDGRKTFAVLPYDEFQKIQELLDEYENLKTLREAKATEADAPATPLGTVRQELDI